MKYFAFKGVELQKDRAQLHTRLTKENLGTDKSLSTYFLQATRCRHQGRFGFVWTCPT